MMARKISMPVTPRGNPNLPWAGNISPTQHELMVREAAYFRYVQRGYEPGHDVDDWLAAEASLFGEESLQQLEPDEMELNLQESGSHGFSQDDALKRIVKQHPRKGIPRVESVDPEEAPFKE